MRRGLWSPGRDLNPGPAVGGVSCLRPVATASSGACAFLAVGPWGLQPAALPLSYRGVVLLVCRVFGLFLFFLVCFVFYLVFMRFMVFLRYNVGGEERVYACGICNVEVSEFSYA